MRGMLRRRSSSCIDGHFGMTVGINELHTSLPSTRFPLQYARQTVFPALRLYTLTRKDVLVPGRERKHFGYVHRRGGRMGISQVKHSAPKDSSVAHIYTSGRMRWPSFLFCCSLPRYTTFMLEMQKTRVTSVYLVAFK